MKMRLPCTVTVYYGEPTTIQVPLLDDSSPEDIETFQVRLTGTTNDIVIVRDTGTADILDRSYYPDEPPPDCQCGEEVGRSVTGLAMTIGGAPVTGSFWEGDTVRFTAGLSAGSPPAGESFVWESQSRVYAPDTPADDKFTVWTVIGTTATPIFDHTFPDPFIGRVRVTLTSAGTVSSKVVGVRAKAAVPINWTVSSAVQDGDHLKVTYTWESSSGRPADLDGVIMGEFVWSTEWGKVRGENAWSPSHGSYTWPAPFDANTTNNGFILVFFSGSGPLQAIDHHGKGIIISSRKDGLVGASQYYWYEVTDGANYVSDSLQSSYVGDPRGIVKIQSNTIGYSLSTVGTTSTFMVNKPGANPPGGPVQSVIPTIPWQTQ